MYTIFYTLPALGFFEYQRVFIAINENEAKEKFYSCPTVATATIKKIINTL